MPFQTLKRRAAARRKSRLKRTRRMPTVRLMRPRTRRTLANRPKKSGIVRDRGIHTLRYFKQYAPSINTVVNTVTFRANDLGDIEGTGTGHQPRGFDQYMALYAEYAVLSSTISVKFWTRSSNEPAAISIQTEEVGLGDPVDSTIVEMLENNPRTTRVGAYRAEGLGRGGIVRTGVNVAKFLNRSGGIADDADLTGTAFVSPSQLVRYSVNAINGGLTVNTGVTEIHVTLTYRVMFLQPKKIGIS